MLSGRDIKKRSKKEEESKDYWHSSGKKNKKNKKYKKKRDSSSDDEISSQDESSSEDEREKKKKKKHKRKSRKNYSESDSEEDEKPKKKKKSKKEDADDIFGILDDDLNQNNQKSDTSNIFGGNFDSSGNQPSQIFGGNNAATNTGGFALQKPPQNPIVNSNSALNFVGSGQQNIGIDAFASMAAPQTQSFGNNQHPTSANAGNLESVFGQMNLQGQNQFQPQSTAGFGAPQNSFGVGNNQFLSSGVSQNFQQTSGFGGNSGSELTPPSTDIFASSSAAPGGFVAPPSTQPTGFSDQTGAAPQVPVSKDGFGAFQSSEKDAWTMGQGLGKF